MLLSAINRNRDVLLIITQDYKKIQEQSVHFLFFFTFSVKSYMVRIVAILKKSIASPTE